MTPDRTFRQPATGGRSDLASSMNQKLSTPNPGMGKPRPFDSADEAFASNQKAADWVRNHVLEFASGMPEVMIGNALIAEVK
jgi:hypothetical protein